MLKRDPALLGLQPDGVELAPNDAIELNSATAIPEHGISLREALKTHQLWLLCIGKFADFYCLMTIVIHIVPHGIDEGLAPAAAARILAIIGIVSIIGRIAVGTLSLIHI